MRREIRQEGCSTETAGLAEEINSVVQGLPCSGWSVWSQMAYNVSNAIEKVNAWSHKYVFPGSGEGHQGGRVELLSL